MITTPAAFEIMLPPGWSRIDLTAELDPQVTALVGTSFPDVPPGVALEGVREAVGQQLHRLREIGAIAAVLPSRPLDGVLPRASLLFTPWLVEGTDPVDLLLALAASDPTATVVDIDGLLAVRTVAVEEFTGRREKAQTLLPELYPDADLADSVTVQRVRYLLGELTRPDHWLDVQLRVQQPAEDGGREYADALIDLLDAIVESLTWTP